MNYSNILISNSKCKFCKTSPKYIYYFPTKISFENPLDLVKSKQLFYPTDFYYLADEPKYFTSIARFSTKLHLSADIRYNQYYKLPAKLFADAVYICTCTKTGWMISLSNRQHIKNRKSNKIYPLKVKPF